MTKFIKGHRFLAGFLSIIISVFLVSVVVYAATTIGTNVNTAGTVTMESASTTNDFWLGNVIADDDDYLYMDASSSQYMMWDDDPGQFAFSDDLQIDGNVSTTEAIIVGGEAGDDDDIIYFDSREENLTWDNDPGQFTISDDLKVTGVTTSTLAFWVGTGGTVDNLDMTGGDLYAQGDAEIDGGLWVNSATTTDSLAIGGYASSTGDINTQADLHVGGNADVDGTFDIGGGSTITKLTFGVCNIEATTITATSSAFADCTGATGVASADKVFVTATSSLPTNFAIQAASSTAADVISLRIFNHGYAEGTDTGARSFYWMAVQ